MGNSGEQIQGDLWGVAEDPPPSPQPTDMVECYLKNTYLYFLERMKQCCLKKWCPTFFPLFKLDSQVGTWTGYPALTVSGLISSSSSIRPDTRFLPYSTGYETQYSGKNKNNYLSFLVHPYGTF